MSSGKLFYWCVIPLYATLTAIPAVLMEKRSQNLTSTVNVIDLNIGYLNKACAWMDACS